MAGRMDCFGTTHVGRRRTVNEDQFLIADLNKSLRVHNTSLGLDHQTRLFGSSQGKLLLVADGMGGEEAGERASVLAVDGIANYVLNTLPWFFRLEAERSNEFEEELKEALLHCQTVMQAEVEAVPQRKGMGTTLTMAYILWPRLFVVHVGDSRCYLLRGESLQQLTRDHTWEQLHREAKKNDKTSTETPDTENGPWSHVLWNVIGGGADELSPDVYKTELQMGDSLLLCTDGLSRHVGDEEIAEALAKDQAAEQGCESLVQQANDAGGSDNITVILARFHEQSDELMQGESKAQIPLASEEPSLVDTQPFDPTLNEHIQGELQPAADIKKSFEKVAELLEHAFD